MTLKQFSSAAGIAFLLTALAPARAQDTTWTGNANNSGDFDSVTVTGLTNGETATFNPANGTVTVVPEPATLALLGLGGAMLILRRRRCKPTLIGGATAALALMLAAAPAHATLIAYDGFDYADGDLREENGGTGDWTGAWAAGSGFGAGSSWQVGQPSLSYTDSGGRTLLTTGGRIVGGGNEHRDTRTWDTTGRKDEGDVVWFSFLFNRNSGNIVDKRIYIVGDGTIATGLGVFLNPEHISARINAQTEGFLPFSVDEDHFVAGRITFSDLMDDEVRLWLDPELDQVPLDTASNSAATRLAVNPAPWSNLYMRRGEAGADMIDEIRIGTDFFSVVPVPEPLSLGLAGMGALIVLLRRRRRKAVVIGGATTALALMFAAAPVSAVVVFHDTFDVGAPPMRDDEAGDPLDRQWYKTRNTTLSVVLEATIGSGNALDVDNSLNFQKLGANFGAVSLDAVNDAVVLSFDFRRTSTGTPSGTTPDFRFGLYDSGGSPIGADSDSVLNSSQNDIGYLIGLGVGQAGAYSEREGPESNGILGGPTGTNEKDLGTGGAPGFAGIFDDDAHAIRVTISRLVDGVHLFAEVDGTSVIDVSDSGDAFFVTDFDVVGFGIGSTSVVHDYRLDNIRLETAVVPEPTSLGLLTVGGLMLLRRQRMRRSD